MKYTIEGLSQELIVSLGLDNTDALIISWILGFYLSERMLKINVKDRGEFFWVNYTTIMEELPSMRITSKKSVCRRMDKLIEAGILEKYVLAQNGTFTYFAFRAGMVDRLQSNTTVGQKSTPIDKNVHTQWTEMSSTSGQKCPDKDSYIKDSYIKDNERGVTLRNVTVTLPPTSENDSIKEGKKTSYKQYTEQQFIEECNSQGILDSSERQKFVSYWSEKSASGKMRFQMQQTWETSRRMATWKNNSANFSKGKQANKPFSASDADERYKGL
jgi:hypothetical protein